MEYGGHNYREFKTEEDLVKWLKGKNYPIPKDLPDKHPTTDEDCYVLLHTYYPDFGLTVEGYYLLTHTDNGAFYARFLDTTDFDPRDDVVWQKSI